MKKVEAGQLRETVAVQVRTDVADDYGGYVGTWANVTGKDSVRAAVRQISARNMMMAEYLAAGQINSTLTHEVDMRHDSAITRNNRLIWGSRTLNILRVNDWDTKHRWMTVECAEDV